VSGEDPTEARSPSRPLLQGEREKKVRVARIGAAHGVRGEVKLWSFTEEPMAVADYGALETEDGARRFEIETLRPAKNFLVARLKGVADRTAAETLCNLDLYIPRDRLPPIEDTDTFYYADLVGLAAVSADGAPFGTVIALHNFGAGDLIEIAPQGGGEPLLLPFNDATVPTIDMAAGRIVVVPPEIVTSIPPLKAEGRDEE
jgi:16S rRNA processing protein RimM